MSETLEEAEISKMLETVERVTVESERVEH